MTRPIWFVNLLKKLFPKRFAFAKLTHLPGIGAVVDRMLFQGDDVIYLPKDNVIPVNVNLIQPENEVLPSKIVEYFINLAQHHWIMDFCICREGDVCQDYPTELGCLFLGEAVRHINPKLGRLVSKEEALDHAKK